jgi:hypothetical protein
MLYVVNGKIYCTYIAAVPMGGVDSINGSKLNKTLFFFHIRTLHLDIIRVLFIHQLMHSKLS